MMRALTLTQPWATLVAIGAKRIETRSWEARHRGEVAIHASKSYPGWARAYEDREPFRSALRPGGCYQYPFLACGMIIAVANLVACEPTERFRLGFAKSPNDALILTDREYAFGDFSAKRFGFILTNVRRVTPIAVSGQRFFWTVPDSIELAIREELAA